MPEFMIKDRLYLLVVHLRQKAEPDHKIPVLRGPYEILDSGHDKYRRRRIGTDINLLR